jgi:hypothetical protein
MPHQSWKDTGESYQHYSQRIGENHMVVIAQYTDAIRSLMDTFTGTLSEQHREVNPGHIKKDLNDLQIFQAFLECHNQFTTADCNQLINISTGVIADDRMNVDNAISIGTAIHELTDKKFGDFTMKRSQQAQTFAIMRKSVKVDGEDVSMGSAELHQRLLSIACTSSPPNADVFRYELATFPPAMFQDDGTIRKSQKSQLAKHILQLDADITSQEVQGPLVKIYDGCALLHRIPWQTNGTLDTVCESFLACVTNQG